MFLIIISCIALAIFLVSMDLSWANVLSGSRNELVFDGRNKEYGAFELRREYHLNVFYALLLSVGIIGGGFIAARLFSGNYEAAITAPVLPIDLGGLIVDVTPKDKKPDESEKPKSRVARAASAPASGNTSEQVEIVESGGDTPDLASAAAGDGEGPDDLVQPYDPGSEGGGDGNGDSGNDETDSQKRHIFVINMPEFPGGMDELIRYVQSRVKYTDYELMHNVGGTMYMSFTVFPDGSVGEISVERGIPYGDRLEKRIARVLLEMPRWKPGDNGQEPLPVIMKMPLKFELRH